MYDFRLHDTSCPSCKFGEELRCERGNVSNIDVVSLLGIILWFFWKVLAIGSSVLSITGHDIFHPMHRQQSQDQYLKIRNC
jgi:hypothetical protein